MVAGGFGLLVATEGPGAGMCRPLPNKRGGGVK